MKDIRYLFPVFNAYWDTLTRLMHAYEKSANKTKADEFLGDIFTFSQHISWSTPWHKVNTIADEMSKLDNNVPDTEKAIIGVVKSIEKNVGDISELTKISSENIAEVEKVIKTMAPKIQNETKLIQVLAGLIQIATAVNTFLKSAAQEFQKIKQQEEVYLLRGDKHYDINTEIDVNMDTKQKETLINSILDRFHKGEITKEQMQGQLSEFAKKDVYRTVTSVFKLP